MKTASHFSTSAFSKIMIVILCLLVATLAGAQFASASPGRSLGVATLTASQVVGGGSTACDQADIPAGLGGQWGCPGTATKTATRTPASTRTATPTASGTSTPTGTATATITSTPTGTPTPTTTPTASDSDLSITKSQSIVIGNLITFTVVARNLGPNPADGAIITDTTTADLYNATWSCVSVPSSICAGRTGVGAVRDTLVVFPVGGTITYTMPALLSRWYFFRNTAEIVAPRGDSNPSNNIATVELYTTMLMLVRRNAP